MLEQDQTEKISQKQDKKGKMKLETILCEMRK